MIFTEQKGQIVKDLGQVRLTLPKIEDFKTGDFPIFPWFFHGFHPLCLDGFHSCLAMAGWALYPYLG